MKKKYLWLSRDFSPYTACFWVFQSSLPGQTNRWLLRHVADSTHRDTETDEPKESQWEVILGLGGLFLLHKSLLLQLCP